MNPIKSISYSKYSLWCQCPQRFKYSYIDKFKEPPSPILERGTQLHKEVEEFIKLPGMPLPECAEKVAMYLTPLQGLAISEEFWQADEDFKPVPSFSETTRFVAKLDLHIVLGDTLTITDIKTGKVRPKQMDQLEFYAVLGFEKYPEVDKVITDLVYLDDGSILSHTFIRAQMPALKQMWRARIEPFKKAIIFPPNPTALCGWCNFSKTKGGPCLVA